MKRQSQSIGRLWIPRKRVVLDMIAIAFALGLWIFARPLPGDPTPFSRKAHTVFSVTVFYVFSVIVSGAAVIDLRDVIRSGHVWRRTRWQRKRFKMETQNLTFATDILLKQGQALTVWLHSDRFPEELSLVRVSLEGTGTGIEPICEEREVAWRENAWEEFELDAKTSGSFSAVVSFANECPGQFDIELCWAIVG